MKPDSMKPVVVLRRILFVLAPIEIGLVALILIGVPVPVPVRIAVSLLLVATGVTEVTLWWRSVRRHRRDGLRLRASAAAATREVMGERAWGLAATEFGVITSLVRWIARRPNIPADADPFSYHRQLVPMVAIMIPLTALEVVVLPLLLPWQAVRIVVAILSVYGLVWVAGHVAGFAVNPHLVEPERLVVRHGPRQSTAIPLGQIAAVSLRNAEVTGRRSVVAAGDVISYSQMGQTNVAVVLRSPLDGYSVVRLWADEPRALAHRVRDLTDQPAARA